MVKKMFAVLVLALFILSAVPMALAEPGTGNGEGVVKNAKDKLDVAKSKIDVAKNRLEVARGKYVAAKEKYADAKERYQEHKGNLLQIREKVEECKENGECEGFKKDLRVGVKNHLEKTGDVILKSLEKLQSKIEDSKVMSEEEKEEALADLAVKAEELTALVDEIKEMSEDSTPEELREAIKRLKEKWNEIKKEQKWLITQLINHRLENVVGKHEEYYNAMEMRYTFLEEKGVSADDLSELREIMDKFRDEVEQLNLEQEEATEAWKKAKSSTEAFEEAKEQQEDVREQMRETKEVLREFTSKYREINQEMKSEVEEEVEDETEEESETEDEAEETESEEDEEELEDESETENEEESEEETTE